MHCAHDAGLYGPKTAGLPVSGWAEGSLEALKTDLWESASLESADSSPGPHEPLTR